MLGAYFALAAVKQGEVIELAIHHRANTTSVMWKNCIRHGFTAQCHQPNSVVIITSATVLLLKLKERAQ